MASAPAPVQQVPSPRPPRRRSFAGPIVLIILGIVFLLGNMGLVGWHDIGWWFSSYWPVLLILWGVIKLVEYYAAQRGGYSAAGIGAGGVILIIFLVFFGALATGAKKINWNGIPWDEDGDLAGIFGNSYQFGDTLEQAFPAGGSLHINSKHGDITLNSWDENKIKVAIDKKVVAGSQSDADKVDAASKPTLSVDGSQVTLTAGNISSTGVHVGFLDTPPVTTDLEIYVPRKTSVTLESAHGDIKMETIEGPLRIDASHGDVTLDDITGDAHVTMSHGDFAAHKLTGDLSVSGRANDVQAEDVNGAVTLDGEFFGDTTLDNISKVVRFSSSRTTMQMGSLPGNLKMDAGDLTVDTAASGFSIRTHGKDVHLENIGGDVQVEDRNADVELDPGRLPMGDISVTNRSGAIHVHLPPQVAFQVGASTRGGDIDTDFSEIKVEKQGEEVRATGTIGSNGRRVDLHTEHADISINRGTTPPPEPPKPAPAPAPRAAPTPMAPKTPDTPKPSTRV